MNTQSNLRGIGFLLAGAGVFVLNDSMLKLALADLPPYQVLAMRGVSGSIFAVLLTALQGDIKKLPAAFDKWVFARAALEIGAIMTYILALAHATIGDVTAIFQTTPLLVILGMIFIHREKANGLRLVLVALGFAGALLVAQPGQGGNSPFIMFAFLTALFAALRDLAGRNVVPEIPALAATLVTIIFVGAAATLVGLLYETWKMPTTLHILYMAAAGLFMMLGHLFTFLAYRHAAAQVVAPFYYSFMIWAVAIGYAIFGDIPNLLALCGMALILVSGLAIIYVERRHSVSAKA